MPTTSATSERTRITILVADEIGDVDPHRIAKRLRKKLGLSVIEVLAERTDRG